MVDLLTDRNLCPSKTLHQHGLRATPSRVAILDIMKSSTHALTAEEILNKVSKRIPGVGRATIYRSITLLEEYDLLKKVHQEKGCHGYFLSGRKNGHFITCQNCGVVREVPCGEPDIFFQRVQEKTGFQILDHLMGLSGLCPQCQ